MVRNIAENFNLLNTAHKLMGTKLLDFATTRALTPSVDGFPWDDLPHYVKFCLNVSGWLGDLQKRKSANFSTLRKREKATTQAQQRSL